MIAEAVDVERKVGRTFDADETEACEAVIAEFQDEMESWLNRSIEPGTKTVTKAVPYGASEISLLGPVTGITSITVDGTALAAGSYGISPQGACLHSHIVCAGQYASVVIVYTGGIAAPKSNPAKNAVIARAARFMNKRRDDAISAESVSQEGYSVKYEPDAFTDAEMQAVSRLKKRTISGPVPVTRPLGY